MSVDDIIIQAKSDALLFFEEFGEGLDPAATDWDCQAWAECRRRIGLNTHCWDQYWPSYQEALVNETWRLAGKTA